MGLFQEASGNYYTTGVFMIFGKGTSKKRLYQPYGVKRPTAEQQRYLKMLKEVIKTAAEFTLHMRESEVIGRYPGITIRIGRMECKFYPYDQKSIDQALAKFTTTRW